MPFNTGNSVDRIVFVRTFRRRQSMSRSLILFAVIIAMTGCAGMREKEDSVDPFDYKYPKRVEWKDPENVLKAYYGAKKRGDWKKAFDICDFKEVLPDDKAKKIRKSWEEDSVEWIARYKYHDYYVIEKERTADTVTMLVTEFYPAKGGVRNTGQANYRETMKLYEKKWKLVAAGTLKDPENK